jgi:DNA-binding NtrC family response regulator
LVIDDEKNIREGLKAALELDGYNVELAADGAAGLELALKSEVDLVITDLNMPGVTGEEVLRRVTSETPGIPVIVLTGHGTVESAVDAMRAGAYDFLTKPLQPRPAFPPRQARLAKPGARPPASRARARGLGQAELRAHHREEPGE